MGIFILGFIGSFFLFFIFGVLMNNNDGKIEWYEIVLCIIMGLIGGFMIWLSN